MSETLTKYGFRSDKAKEALASASDVATALANVISPIIQHGSVEINANSPATISLTAPDTTFPMPIFAIQTVRLASDVGYVLFEADIKVYVWASKVQNGNRTVGIFLYNNTAQRVKVFYNAQFLDKPNGTAFPDGNAWDVQPT